MRTIAALALLLAAAVGSPGSIVAAEASPQPLAPASPDPAAAFGGVHDALACVDLTWRVQTSLTRSASSCTVSNASSTVTSVVYLPRWSGPSRVDPELLQWWRRVLSDSAKHEAQHIRILQAELVRLRDVLVARPCASIDRLIDRSKRRSTRAQAAFDRRESTKPLPPMP